MLANDRLHVSHEIFGSVDEITFSILLSALSSSIANPLFYTGSEEVLEAVEAAKHVQE